MSREFLKTFLKTFLWDGSIVQTGWKVEKYALNNETKYKL